MFMIPYAIEGIRKKRFSMPRWISLFQYAGAVSVFITMICAITLISYTLGAEFAFTGENFFLHLVNPVLAIVLFLATETNQKLNKKDTARSLIPFWQYAILYYIMVVVVGKERGGWLDIYDATSYFPVWVVFIMMFSIGYAAAIFLRKIHNHIVDRSVRHLTSRWEGVSGVEMRIEAFGLGRYMAGHLDQGEMLVPMDLLSLMSQTCGVSTEALTKAYIKGVEQGIAEAQIRVDAFLATK